MAQITVEMTTDNSLEIYLQTLSETISSGLYESLNEVRMNIIDILSTRYLGDIQQKENAQFPIIATGELGNIIRQWTIESEDDESYLLQWDGSGGSEASDGQIWSKVYYVDNGRAGWGEEGFTGGDTAYAMPKEEGNKIHAESYHKSYRPLGKGAYNKQKEIGTPSALKGAYKSKDKAQGKRVLQTPRQAETERYQVGAESQGMFRQAIKAWAETKGLSEHWAAIANKIATEGSQPSNPSFAKDLFDGTIGSDGFNATPSSLVMEWLEEAVERNLVQPIKTTRTKMTRVIRRQVVNIGVNLMNQPYLMGGQTLIIGGRTYTGGQMLPKGITGRLMGGKGMQPQGKGTYFTT